MIGAGFSRGVWLACRLLRLSRVKWAFPFRRHARARGGAKARDGGLYEPLFVKHTHSILCDELAPDCCQPATVLAGVKTKPFGRPLRPVLTPAARGGVRFPQVGTKGWSQSN